jgi:hypothetical protein
MSKTLLTFATQERIDVLKEKFDVLTDGMSNWKDPIDTVILVNELNDMRDACAWFTGSELYIVSQLENKPMFRVKAEGYYNAVGA